MNDDFQEDQPYKIGRDGVEGDKRRFYTNRPMALNFANDAARQWPDKVISAIAAFEPGDGFLAVLHTDGPLPDAHDAGYEVQDVSAQFRPTATPGNWASKQKGAAGGGPKPAAEGGTPTAPVKGATARVWAIADTMPTADRKSIIEACVAEGINPSTAGTQYSKWKKAQ